MKTRTKKTEIEFDAEALVRRVEGFAAGKEPAHERKVKLPPPELVFGLCGTSSMTPPTLPGGRGMLEVDVGAAAMRCGGVYCGCARGGAEASGSGVAI